MFDVGLLLIDSLPFFLGDAVAIHFALEFGPQAQIRHQLAAAKCRVQVVQDVCLHGALRRPCGAVLVPIFKMRPLATI